MTQSLCCGIRFVANLAAVAAVGIAVVRLFPHNLRLALVVLNSMLRLTTIYHGGTISVEVCPLLGYPLGLMAIIIQHHRSLRFIHQNRY